MMVERRKWTCSRPKAQSAPAEATKTALWCCSSAPRSRSSCRCCDAAWPQDAAACLTLPQNDDPVRILTDYTEIVFSSALCKQARALACTTLETLECLKDIRVLGKKDLKQLLQWREQCRQHLGLETDDDAVQVLA